jgi:GTP-binding protein EngB required for normal cell division
MRLEMTEGSTDFTTRLGRRNGQCPILVKFTPFAIKLKVLKNTKLLVDSKIRIYEDFSPETKKVRREMIPYLREVKKRGHRAFLKKDKLKVSGVTYDIDYLRRNVQLQSRSNVVDHPADKSLEVAEEITQQLTGSAI